MLAQKTGVQTILVSAAEDGQKLLSFLQAHLQEVLPRSLFMRLVRTGQVRIDGRRCQPFARVATGQVVRIPPVLVQPRVSSAGCTDLDIVFEDETLLVLNKQAGLPVHPGTGWTDSIQTRLAALYRGAAFGPVPVHRLDRDTSGLLLCAKTHAFLRHMHSIWPLVTKAYLCWVQGCWTRPGWTVIDLPLAKNCVQGREKMVTGLGKEALTRVRAVTAGPGQSLLLAVLGTGRTHQIRAHLASQGHPLAGDGKYGSGGAALRLHACALAWPGRSFLCLPAWEAPYAVDTSLTTHLAHYISLAPGPEKT